MNDYSAIELLKNYQLNKSKLRLIDYKGKQNLQTVEQLQGLRELIDKLDYCISCLPEEEKNIILNIFVKRMSMRNLSKIMIMSRTTVARKRDKSMLLLEKLLKTC